LFFNHQCFEHRAGLAASISGPLTPPDIIRQVSDR